MKLLLIILSCLMFSRLYSQRVALNGFSNGRELWDYNLLNGTVPVAAGNPARLGSCRNVVAAVYSERRFNLAELSLQEVVCRIPVQNGAFSGAVTRFGNNAYRQQVVMVGYGRMLGSNVRMGVAFTPVSLTIPGYVKKWIPGYRLGVLVSTGQSVCAGMMIENAGLRVSDEQVGLPVRVTAGMGAVLNEQLFAGLQLTGEQDKPAGVIAAFQYNPVSQILTEAGFCTYPYSVFVAVGYGWKPLFLVVRTSWHQVLGVTPALTLVFSKPEKNSDAKN